MADKVFNVALGRAAHYATLPAASDALVVIVLEAADLVSDATMVDYDNVAAILAGASTEQTTMGRKTVTSGVSVTVDDDANDVVIEFPDQTWIEATGGPVGALVIAYDPDTTGGTDADLIPLVKLDCALTPDGSDVTVRFDDGIYAASED